MIVGPSRVFLGVVIVTSLLTMVTCARADIGTDIALAYSNNLGRLFEDEQTEQMLIARVGGETQHLSSHVDGEVRWTLGAINYVDNTFDDEALATLDGSARLGLLNRRLAWVFTDQLGRQALDPFAPTTPATREYVNFFVTGPELLIPASRNVAIELAADYTDVWYQERPLDNNRLGSRVGLQLGSATRRSFGIFGAIQKIRFDSTEISADYDRHQAYMEYQSLRRRGSVRIAAGRTEIRGELRQESPMVEISWLRNVSAESSLNLELRRGLSNAGDLFQLGQSGGPDIGTAEDIVGVGDPFELRYASTQFVVTKPRVSLNVGYTWESQDFEGLQGLDRDIGFWEANVTRMLSPRLRLEFSALYSQQNFSESERRDNERRASIGLAWQLGRRSWVDVQLAEYERSSTEIANSYNENRVFVSFRYGAPLTGLQTSL